MSEELTRSFYAVMFTDIKDSTAYYSAAGDEAGRAKVRTHDRLLYPIVADHGGEVMNHTGDGLLAAFVDPVACCHAAIEMQAALAVANAGLAIVEQVRIRIALHAGVALRDTVSIFGSIVNTAARIEALADADQIALSGALYAHLDDDMRARCTFVQERELRGTGQVHRVYELAWRPSFALPQTFDSTVEMAVVAAESVTALCTDIERSTDLWEQFPRGMPAVVGRYEAIVRENAARHDGQVVRIAGDIVNAVFDDPVNACAAAVAVQRQLATEAWHRCCEGLAALRVRATLHTGVIDASIDDVIEPAARLSSAAHGGQILLSAGAHAALHDRLPAGVTIVAHGRRALQDERFSESIFELVVDDLAATDRVLRTPAASRSESVIRVVDGPTATSGRRLADVLAEVRAGSTPVLADQDARDLARADAADVHEYALGRVAEWSQLRYHLDTRFVGLTVLVDKGELSPGERWRADEQPVEDVRDLLSAVPVTAMVLLGPPGSGKSTILRRLELDVASALLNDDPDGPVPFIVPLNQFRRDPATGVFPAPEQWLAELWSFRAPQLPPLSDLWQDGRLVLLLDGLNEMAVANEAEFRACVRLWKGLIERVAEGPAGNRFVFSCRSLDYSSPLSSPTLRVPQVRIEPLSDNQVRQYLKLYSPVHWAEVWAEIGGSRQLELFRSPFFLKLLLDQVHAEGQIPKGRAALFTGFVRQAFAREIERDNPMFDNDALVSSRDRRQLVSWTWRDAYDLPRRGRLIALLERLAYGMQEAGHGGDATQVRVPFDDALDIIDDEQAEAVIEAAVHMSVIEETLDDEVLFTHQLVQEYFAGRRMADALDVATLNTPWRASDMESSVTRAIETLAPADPLPPLASTGWEETTVLAAAMAADPDAFVKAVSEADLALAGRCASQPELEGRLDAATVHDLRGRLGERTRALEADLRARIAAGMTLGRLGGPCYEIGTGPHGEYLIPELVDIAGGDYCIGSDEPYEYRGRTHHEEVPACTIALAAFALGRFAVTNAEWAYFMRAGGYDDDRFWLSENARAWRRGEGTVVNVRNLARFWRRRFLDDPNLVEVEFESDRLDRWNYEVWHRRIKMDDEEFERHLAASYPEGRLREPRFWRDPRFNNPMQPVIGISFFEAEAFANWLAAQTGESFRLPTEVEWEAAARGHEGRVFAYGNEYDPLKGNTAEAHLRGPTPVGVFVEGDTPEGISDMAGNTYDLTASLWGEDPLETSWRYPYDRVDGREDMTAPVNVSRVGRGGTWYLGRVHARAAYRGRDRWDLRADEWLNYRGCRIVRG